jgi:hypothetical protein
MSIGIIETLQAEIQSLKDRVTALEQLTKGSDAPRQLTRDDIIEMAKRDVTHLQRRMATHIVQTEGNKWFQDYVTKAEFIVNREKRTVVALVRLNEIFEGSNKVVSRGIAKCHPNDCFNAHIGRAIALRRALGLEVPDEYLNTPQPTEVKVGDVIEYGPARPRVTVVNDDEYPGLPIFEYTALSTARSCQHKIIDDSRE